MLLHPFLSRLIHPFLLFSILYVRIECIHNHLLYSVPYHPETNSIEKFFSQLKHYIKKESPNTYEDIDTTINDILANKIKKEHLINYLKHSFKLHKENI